MVQIGTHVFWDADTQYDLIYPSGKLYMKGADELIPNFERLTLYARMNRVQVLGSVDYHSLDDEEISDHPDFKATFPPHCLEGTPGQAKIDATKPRNPLYVNPVERGESLEDRVRSHDGEIYFRKHELDIFSNPNVDRVLDVVKPSQIILYGVALDICDAYTIDGLLQREYTIYLVTDAVKPINKEKGEALMNRWKARGVKMIRTLDIVEGNFLTELATKLS
jgi:nicotinamidase/pyrazinamidase